MAKEAEKPKEEKKSDRPDNWREDWQRYEKPKEKK